MIKQQNNTFASSITFLNWSGDITITWDSEKDLAAIEALVAEKMKEGYSFFILKPRLLSLLGNKQVSLQQASDVRNAKGLVVPDATAQKFMESVQDEGVAQLLASKQAIPAKAPQVHELGQRAKTPQEVLRHQTMALRPVTGG